MFIHNLTIERCWGDPVIDFYELNITCKNEKITASASECWASDEKIDDLIAKIHQYTNKEIKEFEWCAGDPNDNFASSVILRVMPFNKFGHVHIQIIMQTLSFTTDYWQNNCSMYIETEIGTLEIFGNRLSKLKQRENNIIVSLVN